MLYCERCQVLSSGEDTCPQCGKHRLRPAEDNDPVLLLTAGKEETERFAAALGGKGIPHTERVQMEGVPSVSNNENRCSQICVFVPFGEVHRAEEVVNEIGALKEGGDDSAFWETTSGQPKQPMGAGKRAAVRVFSALLFFLLAAAAVFGADLLVGVFKSLFH